MKQLAVNYLLKQMWQEFVPNNFERHAGVYVLAYTKERFLHKKVILKDVFYVGMTNSKGGIRQRLNQFKRAANGNGSHSAGTRFFKENGSTKGRKTFYAAACYVECDVNKNTRDHKDLALMGEVAKFEYVLMAAIKRRTGKEPRLNKK